LFAGARSPRVGTDLAAVALVPIAAALGFATPGDDWALHAMLAAAGAAAWALIWMMLRDSAIALFTGVAAVATGVLLAAAMSTLWELSWVDLGCGLILIALLITVRAAQLSAAWARFPLPVIPAPGDPTPSPPSLRVLRDLPRRVRVSDAHQTGFIAGAVILSVLGSLAVAADSPGPWGWYLVVAVAVGTVLRARVWDSAPCKAWLFAQPYLLSLALLVAFAVTERYVAAAVALGALAAMTVAWVIVALNPRVGDPETYSLPMRRAVGFLAAAIDVSLLPVMAYLVGIFDWVLNR
jgi:type VII secretion integral membrane protein EccD